MAGFPGWCWREFSTGLPRLWRAYSTCSPRRDLEELALFNVVKSRLRSGAVATLTHLKWRYKGKEAWLLLVMLGSVRTVRDHKLQLEGSYWILGKKFFTVRVVEIQRDWGIMEIFRTLLHRVMADFTELLRLEGNSGDHLVHLLHSPGPKQC